MKPLNTVAAWIKTRLTRPRIDPNTTEPGTPEPPTDRGAIQLPTTVSVSARLQRLLGLGLTSALALSFLGWYYAHAFTSVSAAESHGTAAPAGDSALPPLGAAPPVAHLSANILTDEPAPSAPASSDTTPANVSTGSTTTSTAVSSHDRRLTGSVFARASGNTTSTPAPDQPVIPESLLAAAATTIPAPTPSALTSYLKPSLTPATVAGILPTQRLLLPKGAFIDCTLETAIDSTLPGLTTCITAVDTFSADGKVVLLERGTKLIGETRGDVQQGTSRLFVLWTEARTPNGVIVNLDSPGTDELGRSGLPGSVNRHFFDRFGAAILISMIDGVIQGATQSNHGNGGSSVVYNTNSAQDVLTEVLRSTVNIPPTVTKAQGDRIQILVARDLDFRSVYALHAR